MAPCTAHSAFQVTCETTGGNPSATYPITVTVDGVASNAAYTEAAFYSPARSPCGWLPCCGEGPTPVPGGGGGGGGT